MERNESLRNNLLIIWAKTNARRIQSASDINTGLLIVWQFWKKKVISNCTQSVHIKQTGTRTSLSLSLSLQSRPLFILFKNIRQKCEKTYGKHFKSNDRCQRPSYGCRMRTPRFDLLKLFSEILTRRNEMSSFGFRTDRTVTVAILLVLYPKHSIVINSQWHFQWN